MIGNHIKCKNCGADIEISDAFAHEVEEELTKKLELKHAQALADAVKTAETRASEKASKDFQMKLETAIADAKDEKDRNRKLMEEVSKMTEELRAMRRKDEEREMLMKKRLADEESKIRDEARKKALEEHELKDLENEKQKADLKKKIEELNTKLLQGSQQNQGEVMELAIEELLKREFPEDLIEEVKKGQRGADIVQRVIDKKGNECGMILWESKNAQWSDSWITKLKDDQQAVKADLAVLAVTNMPKGRDHSIIENKVIVCPRPEILTVALALRIGIIRVKYERNIQSGKDEKKEILYQYVTSLEFRQRMEAINEAFTSMQDEVEKEKRWFSQKWSRQEKQLRKVIDNTHGMYGDLEGVVGNMPELHAGNPEPIPTVNGEPLPLIEDKPY